MIHQCKECLRSVNLGQWLCGECEEKRHCQHCGKEMSDSEIGYGICYDCDDDDDD
ncbi:MAG: hypothetical protein K0U39_07010 [Alphaproteobacteria bacterium]|nr:hypothetical protein [Alphaproteobacteria bacterium]